ncbi:MAG: FAD-dependent oxidoreductase [Telluria sp.]
MQATNGSTQSVWMATAAVPEFPPLPGDTHADVCVIGAGIAGLTSAYLLLREGKSVLVIDAIGVAAGESGRTTAHFFPPDERYYVIERGFGTEKAALVADSYYRATSLAESIAHTEQIDCNFERLNGYLVSPRQQWDDVLEREYASTTRLGLDVRRLERVPGMQFDSGPCLCFANQGQFHPLKYLAGLARAVERLGGRIHCGTRALDVSGNSRVQTVKTSHGAIEAGSVVVATNTPFNDRVVMHTKQAAYRTYVIGLRVPKDAIARMLLWDTGDPYYYVRLAPGPALADYDVLVVGGQDHKSGQDTHPGHRYDEIETWTRERFPVAGALEYRWSGEIMEPSDGVAYLGRNPMDDDNVYLITGDSGNGMTHCTAGAMLVTDLILGRPNPWAELYSPSRKAIHGLGEFIAEQANTLAQYSDWVKPGDVDSASQIASGEGALLRDGGKLLAVYRATDGGLHVLSAACTHLGCAVHWNGAEKSWDCPCHGSRFDTDGIVLHGPARSPLAAALLPGGEDTPRPAEKGPERRT